LRLRQEGVEHLEKRAPIRGAKLLHLAEFAPESHVADVAPLFERPDPQELVRRHPEDFGKLRQNLTAGGASVGG
jgi:hypothetical protein